ncbi:NAD(P)-dependent oxidoreductase [Phaeobacter sp. QD34_3]|uniref:NAD-dependent epimerase/dehydratase family protein n=1 Tax=unclassified Phaeobacter TaxID=2621772 RepID=UPI00237EEC19|nr:MULTISPECIES: NAD(P)-dependent oxidoreductase [unclassified Phaeobacter]MDE4134806.1 NAD(P)-dependent oxidoreductase [Phaeobacter sp. QD34_3]MDE4138464.1 NAD(P)-dependent oxidoreductase [Phaeobacter sp. QD34_24]
MAENTGSSDAGSADMGGPATLVLGASGRIGRTLRRCWSRGLLAPLPDPVSLRWQARRRPADSQKTQDWRIFDPLKDPKALAEAARGCAAILCLAGVTPARAGQGGADMEDNIRLGEAALRAGAATGARVLLTSSAAVYGNQSGLLREETPLQPASPYGLAKAEMEARCVALAADLGVEVSMLRIGNIAGLDAILGGWRAGFQLDCLADGRTPRRSYIGPSTLAQVLAALLFAPDLPGVINVAQPGAIEMGDLLRAAGLDFSPRPAPETVIGEVALDVSRLIALLPTQSAPAAANPAQMVAEWTALAAVNDTLEG